MYINKIRYLIVFCVLVFSVDVVGQSKEQRKKIVDSYNRAEIKRQTNFLIKQNDSMYKHAQEYARIHHIPTKVLMGDGNYAYLESVETDGTLYYISVLSSGTATTSNVDELYEGGSLNLNLSGQGITAGVWDDGRARATHQEFVSRVQHMDDSPENPLTHSTHVTGIIISSGVNPLAKGMAFQAQVEGFNFFDDIPEMQSAASNGLLISNHSYGLIPSQLPEWVFGAYISMSRSIDLITNSAPYYLPVFAVGNSRNNTPVNNPTKNEFDLISGRQTAKNAIAVANVLQVSNYTSPSDVQLFSTSSFGPTDDLRVKPDISAKGTNVLSTFPNFDEHYGSISGTSMAAPAVTGTIALLQELYVGIHDDFMKSHQVRALLCGTTLAAGTGPGPDVRFGFGLMNAEKAADVILNNGFTSYFDDIEFAQNQTYTETFTPLDSSIPLEVTIAWNDPAGEIQPANIIDFSEPRLVNDLDLRIIDENGTEFEPYFITGFDSEHATDIGDNAVDNIEKIHIPNPSGNYTVQVTHKGNLQGGQQNFAIVVTGVAESPFNVVLNDTIKEACPDEIASYNFTYAQIPTFDDSVSFSTQGLPNGVVVNFSPSTASSDTDVELTLDNLSSIATGTYPFEIIASGPTQFKAIPATLVVLEGEDFGDFDLYFPANQQTDVLLNPVFNWQGVAGAQEYAVEVSLDADFNTLLFETIAFENAISFTELSPDTIYYWRVAPINECLQGDFQTGQFSTEILTCGNILSAEDLPIVIDAESAGFYESTINVPENFVDQLSKLSVSFSVTHSYVEDLIISLISPEGTEVVLVDQLCGDGSDMDVTLDDTAPVLSCNSGVPAIIGTFRPAELLSELIGETVAGDWRLRVSDVFEEDGGAITAFSIDFCDGTGTLSAADFVTNDAYKLYPNPAHDFVNIAIQNQATKDFKVKLYDMTGKLLSQEQYPPRETNVRLETSHLSPGLYLLWVSIDGNTSTKKLIIQ